MRYKPDAQDFRDLVAFAAVVAFALTLYHL